MMLQGSRVAAAPQTGSKVVRADPAASQANIGRVPTPQNANRSPPRVSHRLIGAFAICRTRLLPSL
jgi:hypothetical protein